MKFPANVDCTILLSCMDNEDCVRIYLRRFALDYCLDGGKLIDHLEK